MAGQRDPSRPVDPSRQPDLFGDEAAGRPASRRSAPPRRSAPAGLAPGEDERLARQLEDTGRYRILRRLVPRPVETVEHVAGRRLGIILDTETTGLDAAREEIIELGMIAFLYDENGIGPVTGVFSALREPSRPISAEITRITGITDDMVRGRSIDLAEVEAFITEADLVVAHNARFDRPFCERFTPGFSVKPWACSLSEVDWSGLGFEGTKLGYLVAGCGLFHNGHRAVDDCHALLEVLAQPRPGDAAPAFGQLIASAARTRLRIWAENSPFHTKDLLKGRGYRWSDGSDGRPKSWWTEVAEDVFEAELAFLREEVYRRNEDPYVQRLTACDRFKGL